VRDDHFASTRPHGGDAYLRADAFGDTRDMGDHDGS
jgi:hypothetical protein